MPEHSIYHAITAFSELGIGSASLLLVDLPGWRETVDNGEPNPIDLETLYVTARRAGKRYYILLLLANVFPRRMILYYAPMIAFVLGIFSLISISYWPSFSIPFLTFDSLNMFLSISILSFALAMYSAVAERQNARATSVAVDTIQKTFPPPIPD